MPAKNESNIERKHFLKKPLVKLSIISFLTIALSISTSSLGSFDKNQPYFGLKIIILFFVSSVYLAVLMAYEKYDINTRRAKAEIEKRLYASELFLNELLDISRDNTSQINNCIRNVQKTKTIDLNIWDFDLACNGLCKSVANCLFALSSSNDLEVCYVRLCENTSIVKDKKIYLNAYYNRNHTAPSVFGKKRIVSGKLEGQYYDEKIFFQNNTSYQILANKEEIDSHFYYKSSESRETKKNHYNQFIAIPVFCHDNKMIGLLEVVCLNDAKLGQSREELEDIASQYIAPFASLFLLLHKLEKALLAGIDQQK